MKAMILAAGLGTRLKPITDILPKALVKVGGVPMLERVIIKLRNQGFDDIVVNVHHFSQQIIDFIRDKDFGVKIKISDESDFLLDTGGGIVKARGMLFEKDASPVLIHNVDILSDADLRTMISKNVCSSVLVSERNSSRKLIFNKEMELKGWHDISNDSYRPHKFSKDYSEFAFSGIYTVTQAAVEEMYSLLGTGKYSVMDYFLHPQRRENIKGEFALNLRLIDIGKPASLAQASELFY